MRLKPRSNPIKSAITSTSKLAMSEGRCDLDRFVTLFGLLSGHLPGETSMQSRARAFAIGISAEKRGAARRKGEGKKRICTREE